MAGNMYTVMALLRKIVGLMFLGLVNVIILTKMGICNLEL